MKVKFLKSGYFISLLCIAFFLMPAVFYGQQVIQLKNPSFEDIPHAGGVGSHQGIKGWSDCGTAIYPDQSPPDIHPTPGHDWSVDSKPQNGKTFLGMVVRYDETHESVGQFLESPLLKDKCYSFSCYLSMSDEYLSKTTRSDQKEENFTTPTVLRIWGGNSFCIDKAQLLAESEPISNLNWKPYFFKFKPKFNYKFIILEVYYKIPVHFPYNGHLLVDNCSDITEIECDKPMKDIIAEMNRKETERVTPDIAMNSSPSRPNNTFPKPPVTKDSGNTQTNTNITPPKKEFVAKYLPELNSDLMSKGQTFRLKNFYFKADSSRITDESLEILDELADFLKLHEDIIIEIGGHTASFITPSYAKKLSTERAKEVKDYLISQGVDKDQLQYEGYGVEKPLVSDDRHSRKLQEKNQRVEIKVLSIRGDG